MTLQTVCNISMRGWGCAVASSRNYFAGIGWLVFTQVRLTTVFPSGFIISHLICSNWMRGRRSPLCSWSKTWASNHFSSLPGCMDTGFGPASSRSPSLCSLITSDIIIIYCFFKNQTKIPQKISPKYLRRFRQGPDEYLEGLRGLSFLWARVLFIMLDNCVPDAVTVQRRKPAWALWAHGAGTALAWLPESFPCPAGPCLGTSFYFSITERLKITF